MTVDDQTLFDGRGLISMDAAATQLGVSAATIRKWCQRYGLRSVTWAGRKWVVESDVTECEYARRKSGRAHQRHANASG